MSIDEKIIAIIAVYAYTASKKKTSRVTTIREESVNLWRLSSKLEVVIRRVL